MLTACLWRGEGLVLGTRLGHPSLSSATCQPSADIMVFILSSTCLVKICGFAWHCLALCSNIFFVCDRLGMKFYVQICRCKNSRPSRQQGIAGTAFWQPKKKDSIDNLLISLDLVHQTSKTAGDDTSWGVLLERLVFAWAMSGIVMLHAHGLGCVI